MQNKLVKHFIIESSKDKQIELVGFVKEVCTKDRQIELVNICPILHGRIDRLNW